MYLRSLYLHHFRNYEEAFIEFSPEFNLFCGPNAQGKTNVLEAIHYLMMGGSFRTRQGQKLIKHGSLSFYLEAIFVKHGIEQKLRLAFDGKERRMIYNSTPLPTVSSLLGLVQGVVLTPDDIQLIKGAPNLRRQFLDIQIAQVDPWYVHHLTRYHRAMRHRNQLLKVRELATIESWEHEMSQSAAYVVKQRYQTIQALQPHCREKHHILTGENSPFEIIYKGAAPDLPLEEGRQFFITQFAKNRIREMALGYTLIGPHKDDLTITIGGKEAGHFASEGQQRSCITTLHMAEWHRLRHASEEYPLFLLDDVGMGLDIRRKERLLQELAGLGQVFLTTTDETLLNQTKKSKKVFSILDGAIINSA